ncbi:MAG: type III-B CRISPR module-associated protein Cmr3 [Gammaproteobacteria bacterium SHHR-1]
MNRQQAHFIQPHDVLFLRGNKLFGDPGSYGESLVPPWPSVMAGAIRSHILAQDGSDLKLFAQGRQAHPQLGTPQQPGSFMLAAFHLARSLADGQIEALMATPADLLISAGQAGKPQIKPLSPIRLSDVAGAGLAGTGISSSAPLAHAPVLAQNKRSKPLSGYWLAESGWRRYLAGQLPQAEDLIHSSALWALDARVGVGLDSEQHRAEDGKLFSMQAIAFCEGVGFLVQVSGAEVPAGAIRLGGDGRAASLQPLEQGLPEADYAAIAQSGRCRLLLTMPGLFSGGWLPTGFSYFPPGEGTQEKEVRFDLCGVKGRLVCAAVPRAEVISGWDLANWQPKAAQRAAPSGCVYWLDELQATPEQLRKLAKQGFWPEQGYDAQRRAEGFNRLALAIWS